MFGLGKAKSISKPLACLLSDTGYSLVKLEDSQHISFCEHRFFTEPTPEKLSKSLLDDVERHELYGQQCQVILAPSLYQLLLMDALESVPEQEMGKALRWQLKGLVDYPLNDICVEAFIVPPHGAGERRKKVFTAVTLQSALIEKMGLLEKSLIQVSGVSIAELALSPLLDRFLVDEETPIIVISYFETICQLDVYYKGDLYLFRALQISKTVIQSDCSVNHDILLEIQRSIDYCLMELKFPEPRHIVFTPAFYEANDLFAFLQTELGKEVRLLDINSLFSSAPLAPEVLSKGFYAVGGALMLLSGRS